MPQQLQDISIDEISLVDAPANAEVVNGRKVPRARVALYKRDTSGDGPTPEQIRYAREHGYNIPASWLDKDDPGTQDAAIPEDEFVRTPPVQQTKSKKGKKKMSKIKKLLKSGTASRDEIARAINKRALKIAKRAGHAEVTSADYEQALLKDGAYEAYEDAPKDMQIAKREPATMKVTKSEARATDMALKLAKREGLSFPAALSKIFLAHPDLYTSYELEKSQNEMYEVPARAGCNTSDKFNARSQSKSSDLSRLRGAIDDDSEEEDEDEPGPVDTGKNKRK